ncbi:MAG TPA: Asp-tRNA(Asn)/Glu-tRNA(Gln) amidotransferase subunit GatC [Kofleriaceae bacterium]|nr:Asp-tRNA(Asn)/Glu-tRNA(Gln) amidotransferase subunit GatC [Kofleriaceae bacterium]
MLTRLDTEAIAHLARLALTDAELDRFAAELTTILDHMAALAEVDTAGVEPMTHAVPTALRLRDDVAQPSLPVEVALADAPAVRDDCFEVPAIIAAKGGG